MGNSGYDDDTGYEPSPWVRFFHHDADFAEQTKLQPYIISTSAIPIALFLLAVLLSVGVLFSTIILRCCRYCARRGCSRWTTA